MEPIPQSKKWSQEFLREQLVAIRAKLAECLGEKQKQQENLLVTETVCFGSRDPHRHITLVVDEGLTLGLLDRCRQLLSDLCIVYYLIINSPDLYGQCDECRGEIGLKRLQATPWAIFCITCQNKKEKRKREQQEQRGDEASLLAESFAEAE